jgi:Ni,Fe-hydrogenase I cytochrome b subunit
MDAFSALRRRGAAGCNRHCRVYWLFAGNKFERLRALFPVRGRDWVNMWKQVKFYLMVHPEKAPHYLGHNPLQQISYTAIYLMTMVMVTGFTCMAVPSDGLLLLGFNWSQSCWEERR